ncbi:MAG: serine protease [Candidatus Rokuibacteriota bacterium]|nr:MAG: serine protease [Candidatus Rokubacteria bacterium]PYN98847.1 MAG: serine protease [Candidatus Rokubacteria bacterium]
MRRAAGALAGLVLSLIAAAPVAAEPTPVSLIHIDGVINPVTMRLVELAIDRAQAQRSQALIIELDTPGGLERSMRGIVQRMLNAELPVIVYVAPTGARAASAGVFITMAAHVAAMAPATNIGAAHPVALSGGVDKESMKKIENDAAAFIRTVALERGRNADWAEKAVRQSVSITEREAVQLKVVDLIAASVPELLDKIDGRTVKTIKGPRTLATRGAPVKPIEVGFRDRVLNVITDPNVAYILMMLGTIGLLAELYNPGAIFPGVIGAISIILAFFAFQSLPINYAGLLLILLGLALLIAEIKFVSHGVLAIGGVVAMGLGSLMLFDAPEASGLRISWGVIIATVGTTAGLFLFVITAGVRAFARRPLLGVSGLVGETAVARGPLAPEGQVAVHGEIWRAVAEGGSVEDGAVVRVVDVQGLTLKVVKASGAGGAP